MDVSLISVFLLGLLGGLHCAGMCGGIVAVLGASARRVVPIRPVHAGADAQTASAAPVLAAAAALAGTGPGAMAEPRTSHAGSAAPGLRAGTRWPLLLAYNAGRITSYTVAGALAGALGSVALLADRVLPLAQAAFVATNLVLIAMGLYVAGIWRSIGWLETLGRRAWQRLQPLAARTLHSETVSQGLAAGLVWGWVPCGMVYGVLVAAVTSGSPVRGALLMAAFGLGTLPNLLALGWSAARLRAWIGRPVVRWLAGAVIVGFGLAGLARIDPFAHLHTVIDACFTALRR